MPCRCLTIGLFGDEDRQRPLLHHIDATQEPNKVHLSIRTVIDRIKYDKAHRKGFILELMAFKLKAMFEAKMKALLGDSIVAADEADANESVGKEEAEMRATGELSDGKATTSVADKTQKSGK